MFTKRCAKALALTLARFVHGASSMLTQPPHTDDCVGLVLAIEAQTSDAQHVHWISTHLFAAQRLIRSQCQWRCNGLEQLRPTPARGTLTCLRV